MQSIARKSILIILAIFLAVFAVCLRGSRTVQAADSGSLAVTASASSVAVGAAVSATVKINMSSGSFGTVDTCLNYDKDKLDYQSVSIASGIEKFSQNVSESSGTVCLESGKLGGISSSTNLFQVNFTALILGEASFSLAPASGCTATGDWISLSVSGASVTVIAGSEPPSQSSSSSSVSSSSQSTSSGSTSSRSTSSRSSSRSSSSVVAVSPVTAPDYTGSTVTFDKTTALADSTDLIRVNVLVTDQAQNIVTDLAPTVEIVGEATSAEAAHGADNSYNFEIKSGVAAKVTIKVSIADMVVKEQEIEFTPTGNEVVGAGKLIANVSGEVIIEKNLDFLTRGITNMDTIALTGVSDPNTDLIIYIYSANQIEQRTKSDASGNWKVVINDKLAVGEHRAEVVAVAANGEISEPKLVAKFVVSQSKLPFVLYIIGGVALIVLGLVSLLIIRKKIAENKVAGDLSRPNIIPTVPVDTTANNNVVDSAPIQSDQVGADEPMFPIMLDGNTQFNDIYANTGVLPDRVVDAADHEEPVANPETIAPVVAPVENVVPKVVAPIEEAVSGPGSTTPPINPSK